MSPLEYKRRLRSRLEAGGSFFHSDARARKNGNVRKQDPFFHLADFSQGAYVEQRNLIQHPVSDSFVPNTSLFHLILSYYFPTLAPHEKTLSCASRTEEVSDQTRSPNISLSSLRQ